MNTVLPALTCDVFFRLFSLLFPSALTHAHARKADAFAERELQMNVDLLDDDGFSSEEQERRGDFNAAPAMGLPSGVFPTVPGRIGTGRGRPYFRQDATASSGVSKFFEDSEEVRSGTVRSLARCDDLVIEETLLPQGMRRTGLLCRL